MSNSKDMEAANMINSARKVQLREFPFEDWKIRTSKSCIMTKEEDEKISSQMNLPNLPDMVFSKNGLSIIHEKGYGLRFDPIDALKTVNAHEDLVHVAMSKEWLEARSDHADINKIAKRYDWTFTPTNYKGTLTNEANEPCSNSSSSAVVDEKIDYEKLKVQEKILFFDEIILYEDELDDNGVAKLSIKIRVMPSGFFILQRFFLRVDNTLIRAIDTRIYHDVSKNYLLREYSERESQFNDLKQLSPALFTNENEIVQHLKVLKEYTERLSFSTK